MRKRSQNGKPRPRGLPQLAQEIKEAHEAAETSMRESLRHARHAGELLIEVKSRLKHGEFGPWIKAHCGFGWRTANLYQKVARDWDRLAISKCITKLRFTEAVELLRKWHDGDTLAPATKSSGLLTNLPVDHPARVRIDDHATREALARARIWSEWQYLVQSLENFWTGDHVGYRIAEFVEAEGKDRQLSFSAPVVAERDVRDLFRALQDCQRRLGGATKRLIDAFPQYELEAQLEETAVTEAIPC